MTNRCLFACCILCLPITAAELRGQLRAEVDTQSLRLPALGDCTLRILSPSILELTLISAKAKGPPDAPFFRVTVAGRPVAVASVGAKRRVIYAPLARRDLRIATEFYIRVAGAIDLRGRPRSWRSVSRRAKALARPLS